jgi:hypothetical protein
LGIAVKSVIAEFGGSTPQILEITMGYNLQHFSSTFFSNSSFLNTPLNSRGIFVGKSVDRQPHRRIR